MTNLKIISLNHFIISTVHVPRQGWIHLGREYVPPTGGRKSGAGATIPHEIAKKGQLFLPHLAPLSKNNKFLTLLNYRIYV